MPNNGFNNWRADIISLAYADSYMPIDCLAAAENIYLWVWPDGYIEVIDQMTTEHLGLAIEVLEKHVDRLFQDAKIVTLRRLYETKSKE